MAKLKGKWNCVCGLKGVEYVFTKPSIFESTTTHVQCEECGSKFKVKNSKKPGMARLETVADIQATLVTEKAHEIAKTVKPKAKNPYDRMG
jgi:hypothetical protein